MNPKAISNEKYQELLKDCEPTCKHRFCFFRMYMENIHVPIYIVVQVQLMVKMKYIWETTDNKDHGEAFCSKRWHDQKFDEAYGIAFSEASDQENIEAIFWRMIEIQRKL